MVLATVYVSVFDTTFTKTSPNFSDTNLIDANSSPDQSKFQTTPFLTNHNDNDVHDENKTNPKNCMRASLPRTNDHESDDHEICVFAYTISVITHSACSENKCSWPFASSIHMTTGGETFLAFSDIFCQIPGGSSYSSSFTLGKS